MTAVRYGTPEGRWVLVATILGSGMAALDATVVNVALPAIGKDLGTGVSGLQWVLTGYLLTLASLILLGGSLGDRFGRRRVFQIGVVWFTVASLMCGLAPNLLALIGARALQGVGGALLTPGSLAIIEASFVPDDRGRAIGAWSGLGGIATAIGPFAGGWLVASVSWRLIFLLNVPMAALVLAASRRVPESRDTSAARHIDVAGAALGAVGLGGLTYGFIEAAPVAVVAGLAALVAFVVVERRATQPMLPLDIFQSRQFTAANLVTVVVYAALGGGFFLLAVDLQQVLGYSPVAAGAALFPITIIMLGLSSRAGALSQRIGPRVPMTVGPLIVTAGLVLMQRVSPGSGYLTGVLPAVVVFGLGLSLTVAPLTATVLAAVDARRAGIASGVNNAVARAASLLAVSTLPLASGIHGNDYRNPPEFSAGFHRAMLIAAALTASGAVLAWFGIRNEQPPAGGASVTAMASESHCSLDAPPLRVHGPGEAG
jgi:EmrB/QacA subfamily drug resistance transporter